MSTFQDYEKQMSFLLKFDILNVQTYYRNKFLKLLNHPNYLLIDICILLSIESMSNSFQKLGIEQEKRSKKEMSFS